MAKRQNGNGHGGLTALPVPQRRPSRGNVAVADWPPETGSSRAGKVAVSWPAAGMVGSLSHRFGMDDSSVAVRRAFVRLGEEERVLLSELEGWAQQVAPEIAREFYDWQFSFPATRQFFDNFASEKGLPVLALRSHLEAAQTGYLIEIFAGASVNWDVRYFEKRLQVGAVHDRINLPFKWYVGSYPEYSALFAKYLRRDIADEEKVREIERAIGLVFNLDLQAIGDSFIVSTLEGMLGSAGIKLEDVCSKGDRAEQVGKLKLAISTQLESFVSGIKNMAAEHDRGDIDVRIEPAHLLGAFKTMAHDVNDMIGGHIAVKKKAMACVAEFGKGNFEAPLERFPGKKAFINDIIEEVRHNLKALIADLHGLSAAAVDGKLTTRADGTRHLGDFREIVEGINQILNTVLEPINEAAGVLSRIAEGDLTANVRGDYRGDHAAMKNNINKMTSDLRDSLRQVALGAGSVTTSASELISVSHQMAGNAEETATQANIVSAASEQVTQNINTVSSATEQMQTSIREIAKNSNEAARVAKHAVDVAQTTNLTITKLGASSTEIGNVIKVITSIAQQTNLLALNATIEAARAGEAGKGFAVVANEVKELAKQTAKATEEISKKIEAIQADTGGAVKAIDEIGSIINQINDITNSIASAVEEQTVTTNEISRSVGEAASGSSEISRNISGVAVAAQGTTRGALDSQHAAEALSKMAEQLAEVVARFKV